MVGNAIYWEWGIKVLELWNLPFWTCESLNGYWISDWRCQVLIWVFESIFQEKFRARDINSEFRIDFCKVFKSMEVNDVLYAEKLASWGIAASESRKNEQWNWVGEARSIVSNAAEQPSKMKTSETGEKTTV